MNFTGLLMSGKRQIISAIFVLKVVFFSALFAQEIHSLQAIEPDLLMNANAVIRYSSKSVELKSEDQISVSETTVITVLNKKGLVAIQPWVFYDNDTFVEFLEAQIYDKNGERVRRFVEKDFQDVSASGSRLYSDNRLKLLDFTPAFYPFTFELKVDWRSSSTGFIPHWVPNPFTGVSVAQSKYVLKNPSKIPLEPRTYNLEGTGVNSIISDQLISYEIKNLPAIKQEEMGPHYSEFLPMVKIAPSRFVLKGKRANITNWKDFGLWQYRQLLNGRRELPQSTIAKVNSLVLGVEDPKKKAQIIYEYMQSRTRYVNVQIGIGGWQPSLASEVDKLGYGDCKGLTNYTMALLETQGIESYYTLVDSGPYGNDIDEDFVALQGNHVILTIPFDDGNVFLECTDQNLPFNFLGTHTDDRKVFAVSSEGGQMLRTHEYSPSENESTRVATVRLKETLELSGEIEQISKGLRYYYRYEIEHEPKDDIDLRYKKDWSHLNSLRLSDISFNNNKKEVVFAESMMFEIDGYVSKVGSRFLLNPNVFNRIKNIPYKSARRDQMLEIRRGYTDVDQVTWHIPPNFDAESIFEPIHYQTKFGTYEAKIEMDLSNKLIYRRTFTLNSGRFPNSDFNEYVDFIKNVARYDRSSIVISRK